MAAYLGSTPPTAVYVGSTPVTAVYVGATQVWASFTPSTTTYSTVGTFTYAIPAGAKALDIICIGGGAGGTNGVLGNGQGGKAGATAAWTAVRGTGERDLPISTTSLTVVVGAGGASNVQKGADTTVKGTGLWVWFEYPAGTWHKADVDGVNALGGNGGMGAVNVAGGTPTSAVLNGTTYAGGAGGSALGTAGNSPGGGGAGGGFGGAGGKGGNGQVWIRAY